MKSNTVATTETAGIRSIKYEQKQETVPTVVGSKQSTRSNSQNNIYWLAFVLLRGPILFCVSLTTCIVVFLFINFVTIPIIVSTKWLFYGCTGCIFLSSVLCWYDMVQFIYNTNERRSNLLQRILCEPNVDKKWVQPMIRFIRTTSLDDIYRSLYEYMIGCMVSCILFIGIVPISLYSFDWTQEQRAILFESLMQQICQMMMGTSPNDDYLRTTFVEPGQWISLLPQCVQDWLVFISKLQENDVNNGNHDVSIINLNRCSNDNNSTPVITSEMQERIQNSSKQVSSCSNLSSTFVVEDDDSDDSDDDNDNANVEGNESIATTKISNGCCNTNKEQRGSLKSNEVFMNKTDDSKNKTSGKVDGTGTKATSSIANRKVEAKSSESLERRRYQHHSVQKKSSNNSVDHSTSLPERFAIQQPKQRQNQLQPHEIFQSYFIEKIRQYLRLYIVRYGRSKSIQVTTKVASILSIIILYGQMRYSKVARKNLYSSLHLITTATTITTLSASFGMVLLSRHLNDNSDDTIDVTRKKTSINKTTTTPATTTTENMKQRIDSFNDNQNATSSSPSSMASGDVQTNCFHQRILLFMKKYLGYVPKDIITWKGFVAVIVLFWLGQHRRRRHQLQQF